MENYQPEMNYTNQTNQYSTNQKPKKGPKIGIIVLLVILILVDGIIFFKHPVPSKGSCFCNRAQKHAEVHLDNKRGNSTSSERNAENCTG